MADVMKFVQGATTVTFSPIEGYRYPEHADRQQHIARDGTAYFYEQSLKKKWEIPLNDVSSADYTQIVTWWQNMTKLSFYPDLENDSGTSYYVRITNLKKPLQPQENTVWGTKYAGTLEVRQVPALS